MSAAYPPIVLQKIKEMMEKGELQKPASYDHLKELYRKEVYDKK